MPLYRLWLNWQTSDDSIYSQAHHRTVSHRTWPEGLRGEPRPAAHRTIAHAPMASVVEPGTFPQGALLPASSNPGPYPASQDRDASPTETANVGGPNLSTSFAQPSTPQHRKMSYGMGGYGIPNGTSSGAQNGYANGNGSMLQHNPYGDSQSPSIYTVYYPPRCASLPIFLSP